MEKEFQKLFLFVCMLASVFFILELQAQAVSPECPQGFCSLKNGTNDTCNIPADTLCSAIDFCNGDGQCFRNRNSVAVFCNCSEGRYGTHCEHAYDAPEFVCTTDHDCHKNPCKNGTCSCRLGFRGSRCEIEKRVTVSVNLCKNGGTPYIQGPVFGCMCPCGFTGLTCHKAAFESYLPKRRRTPPVPMQPVTMPPFCLNGGVFNRFNTTCRCPCGYFGNRCEYSNDKSKDNYMDWCTSGLFTCSNGGTCKASSSSCKPQCICSKDFYGNVCQNKIPNGLGGRYRSVFARYILAPILILFSVLFVCCLIWNNRSGKHRFGCKTCHWRVNTSQDCAVTRPRSPIRSIMRRATHIHVSFNNWRDNMRNVEPRSSISMSPMPRTRQNGRSVSFSEERGNLSVSQSLDTGVRSRDKPPTYEEACEAPPSYSDVVGHI